MEVGPDRCSSTRVSMLWTSFGYVPALGRVDDMLAKHLGKDKMVFPPYETERLEEIGEMVTTDFDIMGAGWKEVRNCFHGCWCEEFWSLMSMRTGGCSWGYVGSGILDPMAITTLVLLGATGHRFGSRAPGVSLTIEQLDRSAFALPQGLA